MGCATSVVRGGKSREEKRRGRVREGKGINGRTDLFRPAATRAGSLSCVPVSKPWRRSSAAVLASFETLGFEIALFGGFEDCELSWDVRGWGKRMEG